MLIHVHQQGIRRVAGIVSPEIGLSQTDPVEGLVGQAVATVGQRFWVGIHAAEGINDAGVSLDVGRRTEMVRRVSDTNTDGGAVGVAD